MPCSCNQPKVQMVYYDPRSLQMPMPGQGGMMPMPGQGGMMPMPGQGGMMPMPGQGGMMPMPGQGGMMPMPGPGGGAMPLPFPTPGGGAAPMPLPFPPPDQGGGGLPPQLSQANLPNVLAQYPRPVGQPPADMLFLYNMLRNNPQMLQSFIAQQPQTLQQGLQFAQTGTMGPRDEEDDVRVLPGFCFNRWSLIFTRSNVLLMFPVANLFGFVIGWCHPLTPCLVPNFQILFAFC